MLTLADSFRIEDHTIFRDLARSGERWLPTSQFYALPDRPRLANDADGRPLFDALRYRSSPGGAGPRGAVVSMSIELGVASESRDALRGAVRAALELPAAAPVELAPLPIVEGTVALAFAGESSEADFVRRLAGNGPARLMGHERASFLVELSEEAGALLWTALQSNFEVLHARYDLDVQHALGDVILRVWCEARQAHAAVAARLTGGSLTPQDLRNVLQQEQLAGYEVVTERLMSDEERRRLNDVGAALLEQVLTEALFMGAETSDAPELETRRGHARLRPFTEALSTQVNRRITQSYPAIGHLVVQDILRVARFGADLAGHMREIDLDVGAARALDLVLHCTVDFSDDLVQQVKATVTPVSGHPGAPLGEFAFRDGVTTARYRIDLPSGASRRYRIDALIYYHGDPQPFAVSYPENDAAVAVLDLDGVGSLSVQASLGDVPFERIRQVKIELTHPGTGAATQTLLDRDHPTRRWRAIIREKPPTYHRRAVWLLEDDSRIEEPWEEATATHWVLNAPARLRESGEVLLVSGGSFSSVAQIVVELRAEATDAPARFTFTAPGQSHTWPRPESSGSGGDYQAREVAIDREGRVSETPWRTDDRPVIAVRDRMSYTVRILSRLLPLDLDHPIALLVLEPVDGPDTASRTTLTLRDAQETSWTFRVSEPDRHRYRYQVTLVSRTGVRRAGAWEDGEASLLVLRPPA